jgi:hypothetical protein
MSTSTDRQHYREVLAQIAERAKERLPQATNGRLESAVALVLHGDVEPQDDGTVTVYSASDATRRYILQGQSCTCTDFTSGKAPGGWCKHRISAGLHKRLHQVLARETPADLNPALGAASSLPEARASLNFKAQVGAYEVMVTLRGDTEAELFERLQAVLKRPDIRPLPARPAPRQGQWKKAYQGR